MTPKNALQNPYIAGRALGQDRGFFGRDDILRLVETTLQKPEQNALVLFGQRRIGKTSILLQLQRRLPSPPFLPVYFDLMDRARRPLGQVLYEIAATIAAEANLEVLEREQFDDQGVYFRRTFLPLVYRTLGDERSPVLLLDEFDVLDMAAEEQLPPTAAAQAFFPYLRELLEGEPRLKFVFVVGRRAEDLSINAKAAFKASVYQRVSVLDKTSAFNLISTAEQQNTLTFTRPAIERIFALTSGHPYFIQLLCQVLWDAAYAEHPQGAPAIDIAHVEAAAETALQTGQNIFEWIWDGLPPAERLIFAAIAEATGQQAVVTEDQLSQLLQSYGVRILTRELELAPRTLVEWDMLSKVDGGYRFFIELMRRWVTINKPLPKVKNELDRVVPLADTLYRSADGFYRQGDTESAQDQLRRALQINPNHLKARLLLGQILIERGAADEALHELEEAFQYDEEAARYPLVRALLARGRQFEQAKQDEEALKAYDRVLKISPREQVARERRATLLVKRGDEALKANNFAAAIDAYTFAGAHEKAAEAEKARHGQMVERQVAEAGGYEARGEWDRAIEIYQRLREAEPAEPRWHDALVRIKEQRRQQAIARSLVAARDYERREAWDQAVAAYERLHEEAPDDQRWVSELARARVEQELRQKYAAATAADAQQNWAQAIPLLADIVRVRPDYKDAAAMLARAAQRQKQGTARSGLSYALIFGIVGIAVLLSVVWGVRTILNRNIVPTPAPTLISGGDKAPTAGIAGLPTAPGADATAQAATRAAATQLVAAAETATVQALVIGTVSAQTATAQIAAAAAQTSTAQAEAQAAATQAAIDAQTATAEILALQTATASAATAAAIAQDPTAQLRATDTAWAQKPVLIHETFDDNASNWDIGEFKDGNYLAVDNRKIGDGKLQWQTESLKAVIAYNRPALDTVSNFYMSVEAARISGEAKDDFYGLTFRRSVDQDQNHSYYEFLVTEDGYFIVDMWLKGTYKPIMSWTRSAAIRPGQVNHLIVIAEGQNFRFYINDELVSTLSDDHLASGWGGLAAGSFNANEKASFEFDNFEIRQ